MPSKGSNTRFVGFEGEKCAENILISKGYDILKKNYYTKEGEIDIIAKDHETLVFVEVKLRKSKKYGMPEEAVDLKKLKRIEKAGRYFLSKNKIKYKNLRIDVVSLLFDNDKLVRGKILKGVYLW